LSALAFFPDPGLSFRDVAGELGIRAVVAEMRYSRAIKKLRRILRDLGYGWPEED
jgi:DNA-directed RNA polymerase specialized sigma24 family protein